jgi:small nuclear ribonucleoprotein E
MNLVVDDAVEVGQVTKTNEKETRRPLGTGVAEMWR